MNDTTAYLIVSAICGLILAGMKVCYDSKCVRVKCGCIEIERDVEEEANIEEMRDHSTPQHRRNSRDYDRGLRPHESPAELVLGTCEALNEAKV